MSSTLIFVIDTILPAVSSVVLIILGAIPIWLLNRQNKLWWVDLSRKDTRYFSSRNPETTGTVYPSELRGERRASKEQDVHVILFRYTGTNPLNRSCIIKPISLTRPGTTVVRAWQMFSSHDVDIDVSKADDRVVVKWDLVNPGWSFVIGILCASSSTKERWHVDGVVQHISRIIGISSRWPSRLLPVVAIGGVVLGFFVGDLVWRFLPIGLDAVVEWLIRLILPALIVWIYILLVRGGTPLRYLGLRRRLNTSRH